MDKKLQMKRTERMWGKGGVTQELGVSAPSRSYFQHPQHSWPRPHPSDLIFILFSATSPGVLCLHLGQLQQYCVDTIAANLLRPEIRILLLACCDSDITAQHLGFRLNAEQYWRIVMITLLLELRYFAQ